MSNNKWRNGDPLIDPKQIETMLYDDEEFIKEFAAASVESFTEFKVKFRASLLSSELDDLRRAGHKIKPAAQMLHLHELTEMYETAKQLIENNHSADEKKALCETMVNYCETVINEFRQLA
ncbi:MAG: taurine dioxygenase [Balneolaceae bacterium]